jgi:hypothetical protein
LAFKRYFFRKRFIAAAIVEGRETIKPESGFTMTTLEDELSVLDK